MWIRIRMRICQPLKFSTWHNREVTTMKKHIMQITISFVLILIGDGLANADSGNIDIHGFISQGYLKTTDNDYMAETKDGTFQYNEMGLNFTASLTHDLRMGVQLFARDLGLFGNDKIEVDWAYAEYRLSNPLGIRAGKFKVAHGLYNEARDVDAVRTVVMLPRSVYLEGMRDIFVAMKGINVFGQLPFGVSYLASLGTQDVSLGDDIANIIYTFTKNGFKGVGFDVNGTINTIECGDLSNFGLVWETPLEGLKVSFTNYNMEFKETNSLELSQDGALIAGGDSSFTFNPHIYTFSLEYIFYNTVIAYETIFIQVDYKLVMPALDVYEKGVQDIGGWYFSISHRLTDYLELGAYYSIYYDDLDDKSGNTPAQRGEENHLGWEKDACISMRFDLNANWTAKLEGHLLNGTVMIDERIKTGDLVEEYMLFAAKVSYSF